MPLRAYRNQQISLGRQLRSARAALTRAQRDTQESFKRYKTCLDVEAQALQQVTSAEERRDALSTFLSGVSIAQMLTRTQWLP